MRILLLAYHFPPTGGAGTQRAAKLARDLHEMGLEPVVVTGPGPVGDVWSPADHSLAAEIPNAVEVHRVPGPVPAAGGREASVARWLSLPSPFARWWTEGALAAAAELQGVDAIFATMSPYESGQVAAQLARRLGVPWVADLRDPWALDEMRVYPSSAHRRADLLRMGAVLRAADAVVMNTPEARRRLLAQFPELSHRRVTCVPNGWDARDFADPAPGRDDSVFRIVHTGALHTSNGQRHRQRSRLMRALGGSVPVDLLTRSHIHLMEAVRRVRMREPELAADLQVHLAGNLTEADRRVAGPDAVLHGYLSHARSVELLRSADLLFLPMQDLPPGRRATIVPGKTYEYLASGRPVLAAVPEGDARELIATSPVARLCGPRDVEAMVAAIVGELGHCRRHGRRPDSSTPVIERFERRRLAGELAAVVEDVLDVGGRVRPISTRRAVRARPGSSAAGS